MKIEETFDHWRAHVELHKFTGPTIKVLHLQDDLWALLDHEYNFQRVCRTEELPYEIIEVKHPEQRERPKPVIPDDYFERPTVKPSRFNINTDDLDL